MNEVVWEDRSHNMLVNGQSEMSGVQSARLVTTRSQDDALVGYFFQRPQTDPDFQNYPKQSRWALGDDSVLEIPVSTKKLWGIDENVSKPDESKGIFLADQWRDPTWSTNHTTTSDHAISQPIMVQRRSGSYPGSDANAMLSPRSSDTGGLGVKMVEYVLGSSPTAKDLDSRLSRLHVGMNATEASEKSKKSKVHYERDTKGKVDGDSSSVIQANGILQNGLDDEKGFNRTPGSRQPSPNEDDMSKNSVLSDISKLPKHVGEPLVVPTVAGNVPPGSNSLTGLDGGYEPVSIDTLPFEYSSHFMQSIDSPTILDYNSQRNERTPPLLTQLYQQQRGQPLPVMGQQQFPLTAQQQGQNISMIPSNHNASGTPFTSNPYIMNQDPYAPMGTMMPAGPAVIPQYYGLPPWGMLPAHAPGILQGNQGQPQGPATQQQLLRGNGARPMTPQSAGEALPQSGGPVPQGMQGPGGQYQMVPPPYYDQNSSLMMNNARNMGTTMRLGPPVLLNTGASASNSSNGGRLLASQGQQVQNPTPSLFSTNNCNPASYTSTNSTIGYNASNMGYSNSQLGYSSGLIGPAQPQGTIGYGSSALGPIGTSAVGAIGSGIGGSTGSPRRESFDRRETTSFTNVGGNAFSGALDNQYPRQVAPPSKGGQYFGPLGSVTASGPGPIGMLSSGQSLTPPPPSLNGSSNGLSLGALGSRILSTAPGAEAKYIVRNGPLGNNMFGSSSSLFPGRSLQRNSGVDKPPGRSRLLEDFRNNRYPNLQLRDLTNHIVEFSQDQHGSRFIQQKLERASLSEKQLVFNEILGAAYSLMTDVFGNYVIQKFFEFGTADQKQALAQKVKGHVLPLALQMYGCRVIQKALESIPSDQQKDVVKELDGHVLKCVKDQNGNHVVQKCIECVDPLALQFIINAFQGQVFELSRHPYGCRVIQRILEHCTTDQTSSVLEELHQHTEQLVHDQYGNYVVQHVLEHGRSDDKGKIVAVVRGKVLQLSQHKFASNVVEKCVTHASRNEKGMLIEEVCSFNDGPHSALYTMMKDQYANYVVQKMIEVAEAPQRKLLVHKIRPHIPALRKYTYGKHILAKLEKYLLKNNDLGPLGVTPNGTI